MNTYQSCRNRPRKKSLGHACVTISSEIFKIVCITNKKMSQFLVLTVYISSKGLVSLLTELCLSQIIFNIQRVFFRVLSGRFLSYLKKRKISQNDHLLLLIIIHCHLLLFVATRCISWYHSLPLVVPLIVICWRLLSPSLSLVVTRCQSMYHVPVFL